MLQINSNPNQTQKVTLNLLPCQIHHDGPVTTPSKYWKPQTKEDGTYEAYLRGRRLQGKDVNLPAGYEGIITQNGGIQEKGTWDAMYEDRPAEEEEEQEEVGVLNEVGSFDKIVLWDHETIVEEADAFVKGVGEWIRFAEALQKPGNDAKAANQ